MSEYARQLLADKDKSDCLKLALLANKAGLVAPNSCPSVKVGLLLSTLTEYQWLILNRRSAQPRSDPNYRVGADLPEYGGFGDSGFKSEFSDRTNQVRHFVGSFAAGYIFGISFANMITWYQEHSFSTGIPDVALGEVASGFGAAFGLDDGGNTEQLAQQIWHYVCGESSTLQLPQ